MKRIILHKYMGINALKSFVAYHSLKLSFGYEANDCFEMLPGELSPDDSMIEKEKNATSISKHGFISLSKILDSPYMWGNYADQYKGARLDFIFDIEDGFDKNKTKENRVRRLDREKPRYIKLRNIDKMEFDGSYIEKCEYEINRVDKVERNLIKCTRNIISNKNLTWAQEEEYRIIYSISYAEKPSLFLQASTFDKGILYSTKDLNNCLFRVCLGPLCPLNAKDVERALDDDDTLRGVQVERLQFSSCNYTLKPLNAKTITYDLWQYICRIGDAVVFEKLTSKFPDIYAVSDKYGNGCLAYAVRRKSLPLIKHIVEHSENYEQLNAADTHRALLLCAQNPNGQFLSKLANRLLNQSDADVKKLITSLDYSGRNILMVAARNANIAIYNLVIRKAAKVFGMDSEQFKNYINFQDYEGRTALMLAAWSKCVVIVDSLLLHDADPNIRDYKDNSSVLFFASSGMRSDDEISLKILRLLDAKHVDFNISEYSGYSPIDYACFNGLFKSFRFLTGKGVRSINLPEVSLKNLERIFDDESMAEGEISDSLESLSGIHSFLGKGITIDGADILPFVFMCTADFFTIHNLQSRKLFQSFLQDHKDELSDLIMYACKNGLIFLLNEIFHYYDNLHKGEEFVHNACMLGDKAGCTPLMWCIANPSASRYRERLKCFSFLIKFLRKDSFYYTDKSGANILIWSARKGNSQVMSLIFRYYKKLANDLPNYCLQSDNAGMTFLMWAAAKGRVDYLKSFARNQLLLHNLLLKKDFMGKTALDWACISKSCASVRYICKLISNEFGFRNVGFGVTDLYDMKLLAIECDEH